MHFQFKPNQLKAYLLTFFICAQFAIANSHAEDSNLSATENAAANIDAHDASKIDWQSLTQQQQETLAPVKDKWNTLPAERQHLYSSE